VALGLGFRHGTILITNENYYYSMTSGNRQL
jgi:hypothetical protein